MNPDKHTLDQLRIDHRRTEDRSAPLWIAFILVIILVLAGGVWWWQQPKALLVQAVTAQEVEGGAPKTVLNSSGYVTARRQATVSSKVTGKVIEVLVEEGMKVKEGQVLARLDASNIEVNLRLAEAQMQVAKSSLAETEVRIEEAGRELGRVAALATNQIASPADLDRAQAELLSLQARLERQRAESVVAERQLALWQRELDDTVIRAPFSGIVVAKNAQPGEMISPISAGGGFTRTGICTITDMESLEIEVDVNESYINRVEAGQPVEAVLDSYPNWRIPAKVIAIVPTADRQKATVKVRIGFEKLDPRILPDMGVKVAFQGAGQGNGGGALPAPGVSVPKNAVQKQDGRDVVWVLASGKAERRAVTLGGAQDARQIVVAGLSAGEKVIHPLPENLKDGILVKEKTP